MTKNYFTLPAKKNRRIYAYSEKNPKYAGLLKVGMTDRSAYERISEQYPTKRPFGDPFIIEFEMPAIREDGTFFSDGDVHKVLEESGKSRISGEWFKCSAKDVKSAVIAVSKRKYTSLARDLDFVMRPEQVSAVEKTAAYFEKCKKESVQGHFLWNAKMRFGKTFCVYQLAKKMNWKKILILTFKPAVESSWREDLNLHVDFEDWIFFSKREIYEVAGKVFNTQKKIVCFGSFQDYLGRDKLGGLKTKNKWVHDVDWDCIILDEYHYGAWRDNAKELFEGETLSEQTFLLGSHIDNFERNEFPIKTDRFLYLSGTPFRALQSGEFIEDQIFNWTYTDEQHAKNFSDHKTLYEEMPSIILLTYKVPDQIMAISKKGEFDEFDLNHFFMTVGEKEDAKFVHEESVQIWLNIIRGVDLETNFNELKLKGNNVLFPFASKRLLQILDHTLWYMPSINSCFAMSNLLLESQNKFFREYEIIVAAGNSAGVGVNALPPVRKAMGNPLETKTITLSCGKLTQGVTVKPWSGIFMLRNLNSPETYFQAAFRVQSAWTLDNPNGNNPNEKLILKPECYIFDFAPSRALRQIMDYSFRLNTENISPEKKVEEFIKFLPVLAFDGFSMKEVNARGILDIAMSGTSATLLARRWESAQLVNTDNETLQRLMDNDQAMAALMKIEGFRSLNDEIKLILNKSKFLKSTKTKTEDDLTSDEKKEIKEERKNRDDLRKQVQKKLIKFSTRIPIFMYLTDYREETLKDVIEKLESDLFKKVTGISLDEFKLLISLNVFNSNLMNDAVYKFKRYEDSSLNYLDLKKEKVSKPIGLFNTTIDD